MELRKRSGTVPARRRNGAVTTRVDLPARARATVTLTGTVTASDGWINFAIEARLPDGASATVAAGADAAFSDPVTVELFGNGFESP